jgi:long-chain acyl-CoA synthetase
MDRLWLKSYPREVPAEIDPREYDSLTELMEESFAKYAERDAFVFMDHALTYGELDRLSAAFGAWLQAKQLPKGARVALMMPNILQYPVALAGVLRAGGVVVNANPLYTARELEHQLRDSGAEAIVVLENFATTVQQVLPQTQVKHVIVTGLGDLLGFPKAAVVNFAVRRIRHMVPEYSLPDHVRFTDVLAEGSDLPLRRVELAPHDIAFLQYTGGTTGVAKGAVLLHRNLIANLLQCEAWLAPALRDTSRGALPDQFVYACVLPLYHAFALVSNCLFGMRVGAVNVLIPNPRDIHATVKELRKHPFHVIPAVNTLLNALAENAEFRQLDLSQLRITIGAGMAVHKAVADKWYALTGCQVVEGYGLTETSPAAVVNPIVGTQWNGSIGLPLPSTEVAILDDSDQPLPLGTAGEIAIRGPQVMAGYWQRPEETAKVMTREGFLKTGDIGVMDERGYIRIVDRKKDMIIVSGFNVYPNEIESVVALHPGVLECAAIGVPDERSGEAVKLFVVRKDAALTEAQLMDYCREQLAGYKKPRCIEFRDELPKTNVGKILRRALRDEARQPVARSA